MVRWFSFSKINLYWSIFALQSCVRFSCTAKWIICMYTYILSFLDFFPIQVTTEHWIEFPVLHSGFSLVINFIHSVYVSILISQFISLPRLLSRQRNPFLALPWRSPRNPRGGRGDLETEDSDDLESSWDFRWSVSQDGLCVGTGFSHFGMHPGSLHFSGQSTSLPLALPVLCP